MTVPEWKAYQRQVSDFLSSLGFETQTDENITGARASHDIDVTARISIAGINQLWLIECKKWKRPVPKERALTFLGIVGDVGADRGLIFSESGFQAGAVRAVSNSNVTLTSISDFEQNSWEEVSSARAKALSERIIELEQKFSATWQLSEDDRNRIWERCLGPYNGLGLPLGILSKSSTIGARLSQMKDSLEMARYNNWPVPYYPLDHSDGELFDIKEWRGLFFVIEETLSTIEQIYKHMMDSSISANSWQEFQSAKMTKLLAALRNQNTSEEL